MATRPRFLEAGCRCASIRTPNRRNGRRAFSTPFDPSANLPRSQPADRRKREERLREVGRAAEERKRTESGVRAPLEESLTAPSQEARSYFSIQLIQYSIHSTLSPAGSTSRGLSPSSITALSSVNAFFP